MDDKERFRQKSMQALVSFTPEQNQIKSNVIIDKLKKHPKVLNSNTLFCYVALPFEVQTINFLEWILSQKKTLLVPKVISNEEMIPVQIHSTDELQPWVMALFEPVYDNPYPDIIDVAFIPWLAFTGKWKRIWRWKGYYDIFFSAHKDIYKMWLGFNEQIFDDFHQDEWDIQLDEVVND